MSIFQLGPTEVGIPLSFMQRLAPQLARDIVLQLDGSAALSAAYGITPSQWSVLRVWPAFVQMVREANEEVGGAAGTLERARRRAALAVAEVVVQDMATISGDPKVAPRDRIAAANLLVEVGAVSAKSQQAAATAGIAGFGGALINIQMPNGANVTIGEAPVHYRASAPIEGDFHQVFEAEAVDELAYEGDDE